MPIVFAWAYGTGLLASLGPTVLAVTLQWPVALLIASAIPQAPGPATVRAGLVLGGGLWQCLLVVTSWTVNRGSAERTAVAGSYRELADYAAGVAAGRQGPPPPAQLPASRVLADPNPLMRSAARQSMLDLAVEAERMRATLTALATSRARDEPERAGGGILAGAARVLSELAAAISERPGQRGDHLAAAGGELSAIGARAGTHWEWAGNALLGQLRTARRIIEQLNDEEPGSAARTSPQPIRPHWIRNARLTLRASFGTSSEAGRHALRLAVVCAVAELIVHASGLSHGYWAVLTIFIVLRPDYSSTLYRGLQRAAGTVIGAGLGVATVELAKIGLTALLAGIAASLVAAYAVFTVNYLLYAVFLTDFVVVLLALLGLPPGPTAIARLIGTGLGTGLAILAYLLWPTWEGTSAAEKLARLISAQGAFAGAALRAYTRPDGASAARLERFQVAARRARIDAVASVDRLAGEPDHAPVSASLAQSLASAGHRIAQALLTLRAAVVAHHAALAREARRLQSSPGGQPDPGRAAQPDPDAGLQPGLDALADGVSQATTMIANALRGLGTSQAQSERPALPALRKLGPMLQALRAAPDGGFSGQVAGLRDTATLAGGHHAATSSRSERDGLFAGTEELLDAIDTAAQVLGGS